LLRPIRNKPGASRRVKHTHRRRPPEQWIYVEVPAIISADVFEAAQQQLARNKRLCERNARGNRYLLQGLTVCGVCGYSFYGKSTSRAAARGKVRHAYYRCIGSDGCRFVGGRVCHNAQVRVDQLDGHVWDSVRELLENPTRLMEEWSRRATTDGLQSELSEQRDQAARLLAAQEASLQRLVDAYEAGVLPLSELTSRTDRVRARLARAREDFQRAETNLINTIEMRAVVTRLEAFADRVRNALEQLDWLQRRQLIRTLVARVEIHPDGATIVYRIPPGSTPSGPVPGPTAPSSTASDGKVVESESCHLRGCLGNCT
jgi:site-specific DNA recombinase